MNRLFYEGGCQETFFSPRLPGNGDSLNTLRRRVCGLWWRVLRGRGQKHRLSWTRMLEMAENWLPTPRVLHPDPVQRFAASHPW